MKETLPSGKNINDAVNKPNTNNPFEENYVKKPLLETPFDKFQGGRKKHTKKRSNNKKHKKHKNTRKKLR